MVLVMPTEPATALHIRHLLSISEFREAPNDDQIKGVLTALADIQNIEPMFSFVVDAGTTLNLLQSLTNVLLTNDAGNIHFVNGAITWFRPDGGPCIVDESNTMPALVRLIRLWLRIKLMQVLQQHRFKTFIRKDNAEREDIVWVDGEITVLATWADALVGMIGMERLGTGKQEIRRGDVIIAKAGGVADGGAFF